MPVFVNGHTPIEDDSERRNRQSKGEFLYRTKPAIRGGCVRVDMSASTAMSPALSEKQRRILAYLREHADTRTYFKSRLIGEALDLSAKEVGTNMTAIQNVECALTVEQWGYSSSTTWKVTR